MLKEYRFQALAGIWGGILFFAIGDLVASMPLAAYLYFSHLIKAGSYVLFVAGCFMYAKGKGHSWYWGALGVLGPLGLLLLYCLKDRSKMVLLKKKKEESKIF
jgi:hypothetical protein